MNRDWSKETLRIMPGGRVRSIFCSSFLTASMTSTVFVPDCFCTPRATEVTPLSRATVRFSSRPSSARPRSRIRTGAPRK